LTSRDAWRSWEKKDLMGGTNTMKNSEFCRFASIASILLMMGAPLAAQETDYPNHPIEVVVPYGPGGGNDLTARVMSAVAADYLGQPVIIRIRPGAGSVVGLSEVARSKADGYTLAWPGPHSLVISAFNEVPLDFLKDLKPVAQMISGPWWLVVRGDSPYNTLDEFLTYAKEHPGEIIMANSGNLAIGHLPALQLEEMAGVEFTHLPFDGGGPAYAAVISGDAVATHGVTAAVVPKLQSGDFKALAVTGHERHPQAPDVPTFEEQGYPIMTTINIGLVAPAGTPPEVVAKLEAAMKAISEDKTYVSLLDKLGETPAYLNSADYTAVMEGFLESSKPIAKKLRDAGVIQ
jgi:putative tricarboxylic transport membrane protein